jgi:hypothetical protein
MKEDTEETLMKAGLLPIGVPRTGFGSHKDNEDEINIYFRGLENHG